ncbi:MAG: PD40 domain-containing protein [Phycisphaerae bacterium]|nr:PD40 domain-containing protein [Phycisphaerae bacterium]
MSKTIAPVIALILALAGANGQAQFIFGTSTNLGPGVNSVTSDGSPDISADGLELYFDSIRPGGLGDWDIWMAKTTTAHTDWDNVEVLPAPVNSSYSDSGPCISADGLSLYFASDRPGGHGDSDIWVTTRPTADEPWAEPVNLGSIVNSSSYDNHPSVSADGLTLYFGSSREPWPGYYDLFVTRRPTVTDAWQRPVKMVQGINTTDYEMSPDISSDGLILFFDRRTVLGGRDVLMATRGSADGPWIELHSYGSPLNSWSHDTDPSISADGTKLYFGTTRPGGSGEQDLWQIPIAPVRVMPDFDFDGVVNMVDYAELAHHWLDSTPAFDIAPPPNGDGIVDHRDLAGLLTYWLTDFRLVAHWKLDETEGAFAEDSVADFDGTLHGDPNWAPAGGMVNGALGFDGIDDFVETQSVLDSQDGGFSIYVWIRGGAPGQVIISQVTGPGIGRNWLYADPSDGKFMADLRNTGRTGFPIGSQTVITDGLWHEIGFAWDGEYRRLYVDGQEVAADESPLSGLNIAKGGLLFGADSTLDKGTFFSGLIDDIRIYNKAVTP